jgi:hypothetical protein
VAERPDQQQSFFEGEPDATHSEWGKDVKYASADFPREHENVSVARMITNSPDYFDFWCNTIHLQ